jgi:hypothetical protein
MFSMKATGALMVLAFEKRDARLLVGIGNGRIDQMPDAGSLRSFRGNDCLTGLFLGPGLVAVAHQKHGADATCCLQNRRGLTEIASHEISACRHQLPRSVTILHTGQRLDAMSPGQQCACNRASLLAGSVADHMNATPMAVEEIAGKTGAHAPSLYRVMRMLASTGVFKEEQGKRFALTPAGAPALSSSFVRRSPGGAGLPLRCPAPGQRRPLVSAATIVPSVSLASRSYVLVIRSWSAYDSNHGNARLVPSLPQQLRQLGDVGGDAPGLVAGEQLGRRALSGGS